MSTGKLIFFGEHSVVYNKKAIGIPLFNLEMKAFFVEDKIFESNHLRYIKELIKNKYGIKDRRYIKIISDIPSAAGLGSSAALAHCIASLYKKECDRVDIEEIVALSEKKAHINPSGIDANIVTHQKPIIFSKLEGIKPFKFKLNAFLVIANSGVKGSTSKAVSMVRENLENNMVYIEKLGDITNKAIEEIESGNLINLGKLMKESHECLKAMNLSNEKIEKLVKIGKDELGYKITGSGLGGCVIFLVENIKKAKKLKGRLKSGGAKEVWIQDI